MVRKRKKAEASTTEGAYQGVSYNFYQVCDLAFLRNGLQQTTKVLKQVRMFGREIAGMHILRSLAEGEELPDLDLTFSYRCCVTSLAEAKKRDQPNETPKHPDLHKTFMLYWMLSEQIPSHNPPSLLYCSHMLTVIAKVMAMNTANMLVLHFRRRLHQYIRFRYAKEGKIQLSYKVTKKLVDSFYRVQEIFVLDA